MSDNTKKVWGEDDDSSDGEFGLEQTEKNPPAKDKESKIEKENADSENRQGQGQQIDENVKEVPEENKYSNDHRQERHGRRNNNYQNYNRENR